MSQNRKKESQEYNSELPTIISSDDLNEKEINDLRAQALLKRPRHNNKSIFKISQDNCEFPKTTIRAKANISRSFQANNFRDGQNLYPLKGNMDTTLN